MSDVRVDEEALGGEQGADHGGRTGERTGEEVAEQREVGGTESEGERRRRLRQGERG